MCFWGTDYTGRQHALLQIQCYCHEPVHSFPAKILFFSLSFFLLFSAACSNPSLSDLLLKCQHFWSSAQHHQERAGNSPSASAHISPPAGPWDWQDFFSPQLCSNVLTHTVVYIIFFFVRIGLGFFFFFLLWSSWTLIMNPRSLSAMSIIQWLSSCSPCCWPNSAMLK